MADQNFSMVSGDTKTVAFTITGNDEVTPTDMSSVTAITYSLSGTSNGTAEFTKTLADAEIVVSGDDNDIATVTIDAADTDTLAGVYYHELEITDVAGLIYTAASGWVTIAQDLITGTGYTGIIAGDVPTGTTFTHEADFTLAYDLDALGISGQVSIRRQDASNYWAVETFNFGAIILLEYVAAAATVRGTWLGVTGSGERISVLASGTTITVSVAGTERISYASASNFQTETDGKFVSVGGAAISDMVITA